jgi:hypothetical protein
LGGNQVTEIFTDVSPENKEKLDRYDEIILISPGGSGSNTEKIKEILADDRVKLLTNRSDAISIQYTNNMKDPKRAWYGPHTYHPSYAHEWEQFSTTPNEWKDNDPIFSATTIAESAGFKLD